MTMHDDKLVEAVARAILSVRAPWPDTDGSIEYPVVTLDPDYDDLPLDHTQGTEDDNVTQEAVHRLAQAAISAHLKYLADQGMVIVPKVPTDEMVIAGERVAFESMAAASEWSLQDTKDAYEEMISAYEAEQKGQSNE